MFSWVIGIETAWKEVHKGAELRIPTVFKFIMKYVCPLYLLIIFALWVLTNVLGLNLETGEWSRTGYVLDLLGSDTVEPNKAALLSFGVIVLVTFFFIMATAAAAKRWVSPSSPPR
jgi:hypothetical protein